MNINNLIQSPLFCLINKGGDEAKQITKPFCCDLLSIAMSKMPEGAAWVTVMANINTLAVAALTEAACIILAEGAALDEASLNKAKAEDITVLATDLPIFDAALAVYQELNA